MVLKTLLSSQLRVNMASGIAATAVNVLVTLVVYPMYLGFLGYENYGIWLVLATIMTFTQLCNLGVGPAVMKLVAEDHGRRDLIGVQRYASSALLLLCLTGVIALSALMIAQGPIIEVFRLSRENSLIVRGLLPYVGALSVYVFIVQILSAVLSGLGRMDLSNYMQTLGGIVQALVAGCLLALGMGITSLLIGSIASYVVIHTGVVLCIRKVEPLRFMQSGNISLIHCKRLLAFGSSVFGGSLVSMLLSPLNKIVLSRYSGVAVVPVYEIAFTASMQIRSLIEAALRSMVPEISRGSAVMNVHACESVLRTYKWTVKTVLYLGAPAYAAIGLLAPVLLEIWLGQRFIESLPGPFRIILVGTFLSLMGVPAFYTLLGLGRVHHTFGSFVIQALANALLILGVVTYSTVSVDAVTYCTSLAMAFSTAYLLLQAKRAMKGMTLLPDSAP